LALTAVRHFSPNPIVTAFRSIRFFVTLLAVTIAPTLHAQDEYRNLESGRPVRISDATPTELYALDLDLTTFRLERLSLGRYRLQYEPRIAYGILPRTEIALRIPSFYRERSISPRGGVAGVGLGGEYQLLMEGLHIPAVALSAEMFVPTGPNALRTSYSVKGLMTRSFTAARIHLNGSYGTFAVRSATGGGVLAPPVIDGPCDWQLPETGITMRAFCGAGGGYQQSVSSSALAAETSIVTKYRWTAGAGIDHSFALKSILIAADVFVEKYKGISRDADWTAEGGVRKQLTQLMVVDGAFGRRFTGTSQAWFATAGTTFTLPFGI
jgi:hypothetical protein